MVRESLQFSVVSLHPHCHRCNVCILYHPTGLLPSVNTLNPKPHPLESEARWSASERMQVICLALLLPLSTFVQAPGWTPFLDRAFPEFQSRLPGPINFRALKLRLCGGSNSMARKDRDPSCLSREESPRFSLPRLRLWGTAALKKCLRMYYLVLTSLLEHNIGFWRLPRRGSGPREVASRAAC